MNLAVVILAAGASSRMGRPKLLLPWNGTTIIGHLIGRWRELNAASIAVVCSADHHPLHTELDRLGIAGEQRIMNPNPEHGMFSSIQSAAQWADETGPARLKRSATRWAIALGDQPLVRLETLRQLLRFAGVHPDAVSQPSRNGRGRHPVILPREVFIRLKDSPAENLKQFLLTAGMPVARCEMEDPGLDLDLDEPADYERALAEAGRRSLEGRAR